MTLYRDLIHRIVSSYGDNIGIICKKQPGITHRELNASSNAIIAGLNTLGLSKGDAIALYMGSNYHYREMFWVAGKGGFVVVPVNGRLKAHEAAYIINDSEAKCLIVSKEFESVFAEIRGEVKTIRHFLSVDPDMAGFSWLGEFAKTCPRDDPNISLSEEDLLWLQYTSGTTGFPKGAMLTQGNAGALAEVCMSAFRALDKFKGETRILQVVPSYAFAGTGWDIIYQGTGATTVIMDRFDAGELMALIEKHKITDVHIVPVMLNLILNSPDFGKYDLSSLKCITYGAAPMPPELVRKGIEKIGPIFVQDYGGSEFGMATILDNKEHALEGPPERLKRLESCGKPLPGVSVKVLNQEGEEVKPGETGELTVESPAVMRGYWKMPEETARALKNGRYYTGDICTVDEEGFIYIKDRKKDLIISGGFNIYPNEVENVLLRHPAVSEAAVFGIPDDKWGEVVCAHIVLRKGVGADENGIIEFVKNNLADYKKPRKVEFVRNIPRNAAGKILRRDLREKYWGGRDRKI
jgi:long-chain acyl-CoA synthetase